MAVNHSSDEKSDYDRVLCLSYADHRRRQTTPKYVTGETITTNCIDKATEEQRARFRERQRQIQLAKERGEAHIGAEVNEVIETRKQQKLQAKLEQQMC